MKRVSFVLRSTFQIVFFVIALMLGITFLWGTFGKSAPVVTFFLLALAGYGYFKVRSIIQKLNASQQSVVEDSASSFAKSPDTLPEQYRGLDIPIPERPLRTSWLYALFWFGINGIAVLPLVLSLTLSQEWRLWFRSQQTQATVVETNLSQSTVRYEFSVSTDGKDQKVVDSQEVQASIVFQLRVGDTVPVRYLPSDPSISVLEGSFPPSLLGWYLVSGVSLPLILWGFLRFFIENARRTLGWLRLQREGQQVAGIVVWRKVQKAKTEKEGNQYLIAFAFEAPIQSSSPQVFVRSEETTRQVYEAVRVGSRVTVRYLPQNPAVCEITLIEK